jgi:hypothetical protein
MLEPIKHPKLASLLEFWSVKSVGKRMPARVDFDNFEFSPWMGHLTILDVIDKGRDFYFRLHGTNIVKLYGQEMTGKLVSELPSEVSGTIFTEYRELVDRCEPILIARKHVMPKQDYTKIIKLLLPLSSDNESVDQLISCSYPVR